MPVGHARCASAIANRNWLVENASCHAGGWDSPSQPAAAYRKPLATAEYSRPLAARRADLATFSSVSPNIPLTRRLPACSPDIYSRSRQDRARPDIPEATLEGEPGADSFRTLTWAACAAPDLPYFDSSFHKEYPLPVGYSLHEMIGVVIDTSGKRFKPGDRVLARADSPARGLYERRTNWTRYLRSDPARYAQAAPEQAAVGALRWGR